MRSAFATADPDGIGFATEGLAAGVAELRDMMVDAWRASATAVVGFPLIKVAAIESGTVARARTSFGDDRAAAAGPPSRHAADAPREHFSL